VRKNRNKRSFVVFKANKGRSMNITQIVNKNPKEPLEPVFRRKYDSRLQ
jgi:hypothetical protein